MSGRSCESFSRSHLLHVYPYGASDDFPVGDAYVFNDRIINITFGPKCVKGYRCEYFPNFDRPTPYGYAGTLNGGPAQTYSKERCRRRSLDNSPVRCNRPSSDRRGLEQLDPALTIGAAVGPKRARGAGSRSQMVAEIAARRRADFATCNFCGFRGNNLPRFSGSVAPRASLGATRVLKMRPRNRPQTGPEPGGTECHASRNPA